MVKIRDAVPDDLDELTAVFIACFNEPPWREGWAFEAARERLEPILLARHFRGAIALDEGHSVGLLLGQKERWVDAFHYNLQKLCVLPDRQRCGIGHALLGHVTDQLRREGIEKAYLITGPDSGAAAFYAAHGYYPSRSRIVMASVLASPFRRSL